MRRHYRSRSALEFFVCRLYVVFIEREDDMIRIISARKATRKEREYYEN